MSAEGAGPASERQIARIGLAAERDYLAAALGFLREIASQLGLGTPDVAGLARAVEEVCLNVIEHGFEPGQPASFDVVILRRPGQLVVAVEDRGLPFDWSRLEAGTGSALAAPSLTAGTDDVRFVNLGTRGNRVEIVKRLPFDHIETYIAGKGAAPVAASTEPSTAAVTVRSMTPDDAIAVARCTYAVYGYTVPDDYLYFPDRIREMLQGGLLEVCVGATPDGEIVSCLTREVARPGAPVGYLGEGMVDPRFRGHRLLEQMLAFVQHRTAEQGMLGLYAEAVTVHPFSQKSNLALGFTETGIQLADEAPTVVFKQIDGTAATKRTATVLNFLNTNDGPRRAVYPPAHHRAMIQRIYERGRFARHFEAEPEPAAFPGAAQLSVEVFPKWNEASLHVTAYGADLADLVRFRLRELRLRRIDWISLDLPLSHPGAQQLCAPIEALGFFFAGIIPELVGDDVLRLQYLNEVEADLDSVQLASDFGKELFAYVVQAMNTSPGGPR
jgi:anti-sigma regulatory factor (Ser/Thr protein kinase)